MKHIIFTTIMCFLIVINSSVRPIYSYPTSSRRETGLKKLRLLDMLDELIAEERDVQAYDDVQERDLRDYVQSKIKDFFPASQLRERDLLNHTETTATEFLEKFGYLHRLNDGTHQHDAASRRQAIKNFQLMYHMKATGILDNMTMKAISMPRCGMPDMTPPPMNNNGIAMPEAYTLPGYTWNKKELTWKLHNYYSSNELSQSTQKQAIRRAFQFWRDVSQLEFTETNDAQSDINMAFAYGSHSDGPQNAFDGPSGVLAHAFYPDSGELHYDSSEQWTDGKDAGINLMIVTAHELGHALGLGHSKVQGALMAPFYQGYDPNFKLPQDDVDGIQSLYGKRTDQTVSRDDRMSTIKTTKKLPTTKSTKPAKSTTSITSTTLSPVQPSGQPNTCTVAFSATTQTHDNRVYVYNGKWMWRMSEYGLDPGYPALISSSYETPPDSVDAAIFTTKHYYTYFFRGAKLWRYYGFQLVDITTMNSPGFPTNPEAALSASGGSVIYLIKGGYCWSFDEEALDISQVNPLPCYNIFPGAPSTFDSALRLVNEPSIIYFFQGNNYYKYSERSRQILPGYPQSKAGPWMGPACGANPYTPR